MAAMEDKDELERITERNNNGSSVKSKQELMRTIEALGIQKSSTKL